jgi:hypothetical protein
MSPRTDLVAEARDLMSAALRRMEANKLVNPEDMFAAAQSALLPEHRQVSTAVIRAAVDAAFIEICRTGRVECRASAPHRTVRRQARHLASSATVDPPSH